MKTISKFAVLFAVLSMASSAFAQNQADAIMKRGDADDSLTNAIGVYSDEATFYNVSFTTYADGAFIVYTRYTPELPTYNSTWSQTKKDLYSDLSTYISQITYNKSAANTYLSQGMTNMKDGLAQYGYFMYAMAYAKYNTALGCFNSCNDKLAALEEAFYDYDVTLSYFNALP